jgi:CheY-like chemotaxis protein
MNAFTTPEGALLIIEDNADVREALTEALEADGWRVLAAADGHTGVQLFRQHGAEIVLVILDLMMPDLDGAQVLQALRAINPTVKVIISSGYNESEGRRWLAERDRGRHDGVGQPTAFLHKPYTLGNLLALVRRVASS